MKSKFGQTSKTLLFLVVALIALNGCAAPWDKKGSLSKNTPLLFIIHSGTGLFQMNEANPLEGHLILNQISSSVAYCTDRPNRLAGTESLKDFLTNWKVGSGSFVADPPEASFVFYRISQSTTAASPTFHEIHLALMDPEYNPSMDQLTFKIKLLKPNIAAPVEGIIETNLFIDGNISQTRVK